MAEGNQLVISSTSPATTHPIIAAQKTVSSESPVGTSNETPPSMGLPAEVLRDVGTFYTIYTSIALRISIWVSSIVFSFILCSFVVFANSVVGNVQAFFYLILLAIATGMSFVIGYINRKFGVQSTEILLIVVSSVVSCGTVFIARALELLSIQLANIQTGAGVSLSTLIMTPLHPVAVGIIVLVGLSAWTIVHYIDAKLFFSKVTFLYLVSIILSALSYFAANEIFRILTP